MIIDENIKIIKLIDVYGGLLTEKQRTIAMSYYFDNLTLSEIGECHSISRQAVKDSISQSVRILNDYESKLQFISKCEKLKNNLIKIRHLCAEENLTKEIDKCIEDID